MANTPVYHRPDTDKPKEGGAITTPFRRQEHRGSAVIRPVQITQPLRDELRIQIWAAWRPLSYHSALDCVPHSLGARCRQAGRQDRKRSQSRYSQCSPQVDGWKAWLPPGPPLSTQLGANINIRGSKMALGEDGAPQAGERAEWLDTPSPHSGPNAQ